MALSLAGGCVAGPELGETQAASTVADFGGSGCSTAVVLGLSRQIADEVGCEHPGGLVAFDASSSIVLTSSAVLPYLEQDAATDLQNVAANHPLQINSALRTLAQQYLLYQWWQEGRCGITAAATVGHSNHESGRAVDVSNWSSRVSNMAAYGWAHDVPGDVVHFDHTASPDIRNRDVTAFQNLWNANNPDDQIGVDGDYGPQTEARLKASPATGFAIGASCTTAHAHVEVASVDGPDIVPPQSRAHYKIALTNGGSDAWPDTAQLAIAGASSPLYDPSWQSTTVITTLGTFVPGGATGEVEFDVTTPSVSQDTPMSLSLVVTDGTTQYGTASLALTVSPDGGKADAPQSSDGDDSHDTGELSGGCNAGGGAASFGAIALVLGVLVRRRRLSA